MAIAHSRVTSQGQISLPSSVRKRLGVGPGSVIEWDEDGEQIVVRKAGKFDLGDTRRALGFERCAVWGFSGGGPHALACAALLPDLVTAAASIGSLAPPDAPGLDYLETMVGENRKDLELLRCEVNVDVVAQPRQRHSHWNCSRKRRSLSR